MGVIMGRFFRHFFLSFLLVSIAFAGTAYAALPQSVKKALDSHTSELQKMLDNFNADPDATGGKNVAQPSWLDGWLIKYGVDRVANRDRLARFITQNRLDKISVTEKYLYHVPGKPHIVSNENYLVIAKKVTGKSGTGQSLNLKQTKQLWKIAVEAGHYDLHPGNFISTSDGKLVIIDTDSCAMPSQANRAVLKQDWLSHGNRVNKTTRWKSLDIVNDPSVMFNFQLNAHWVNLDGQARAFLSQQLEEREQSRIQRGGKQYSPYYCIA